MAVMIVCILNIGVDCVNGLFSMTAAPDNICITDGKTDGMPLLARAMLTCLGLEKRAWAVGFFDYVDCLKFCKKEYPGIGKKVENNRKDCIERVCLGECKRIGVEPCTTPALDPSKPPVTRCKCGNECCAVKKLPDGTRGDDKCCGIDTDDAHCIKYDQICCETTISADHCESDEHCCVVEGMSESSESASITCCEDDKEFCCFDQDKVVSDCCANDGIEICCKGECCDDNECLKEEGCCFEGYQVCGDKCCPPEKCNSNVCDIGCGVGEEICGYECCDPDMCINGKCKYCPTGELCGGDCCVPGECEEGKCKKKLCYYEKVEYIGEYVCGGEDNYCCEPTDCCEPNEVCHSKGSISRCCPPKKGICWGKGEAEGLSWCCLEGWECCGTLRFQKGLCCAPPSYCCGNACCSD